MNFSAWIHSIRLRTLPLAFASIITGSGLAYADHQFRGAVFVLALITTLFLQILSNLANDYGDYIHGVDDDSRVGPARTLQAGLLTSRQMVRGLWVVALLTSVFGVWLILESIGSYNWSASGVMAILGLLAMGAAVTYTMGKKPYGYAGLGDAAVFFFFGWVGVMGTYFLHTHTLSWLLVLPASAIGLFTTAVLNINNMRDSESDSLAGKHTLVVRIGLDQARKYHLFLNTTAVVFSLVFLVQSDGGFMPLRYLFILLIPLLMKINTGVLKTKRPEDLDKFLKKQAVFTFLFSVLFSIGINL
jgi:1,4-dihydroxy-2-naphthoate octaprenyltransferase